MAGNRATALALQRHATALALQRQEADPNLEKARAGDPIAIGGIIDYSKVSEADRLKFINRLVGETSEAISGGHITRIWRSFSDEQLQKLIPENRALWDRCVTRFGGDPFVILPPALVSRMRDDFEKVLLQLAGQTLAQNQDYVGDRMQQLGLKPGGQGQLSADALQKMRQAMQGLAWDVWSMRQSQKKLEATQIGMKPKKRPSLISILMGSENEPVYFDPRNPPSDPGLLEVWQPLKDDWDRAQKGISKAAGDYPEIYEMVAAGDDEKLLSFSRVVPENFGEQQKVLLQALLDRIKQVDNMVKNKEVDLLAFRPLFKRMTAGSGPWATGFNNYFSGVVVDQHEKNPSAIKKLAELGPIAVVMLAPFVGTGIGLALEAVAVAVSVTAAAVEYKQASAQAEVARATPVSGTEMVDRAVADEAEAKATAGLVEAAVLAVLSAITMGAAGGKALVEAIHMARLRSVIKDADLLTQLLGRVSDKGQLYRLAARAGDATKLESLLTSIPHAAQLEALLMKAGNAARLEDLLKTGISPQVAADCLPQVENAAELAKLVGRMDSGPDQIGKLLKNRTGKELEGLLDQGVKPREIEVGVGTSTPPQPALRPARPGDLPLPMPGETPEMYAKRTLTSGEWDTLPGPARQLRINSAKREMARAQIQYALRDPNATYTHYITGGGYENIMVNQQLRPGPGQQGYGHGAGVRAFPGSFHPDAPVNSNTTYFEFKVPKPPVQGNVEPFGPMGEGVMWKLPEGDMLPIEVQRVGFPNGAVAERGGSKGWLLRTPASPQPKELTLQELLRAGGSPH